MLRWLLARPASARRAAIEDVAAVLERDPTARSAAEVVLCYPGLHALWLHRWAHWLHGRRWYLAARLVSHLGRGLTGVEIHPGARIGRRVVIDHGMGVVIGETAEVGDDVLLYQGVTLGGTSMERTKRHPTVGRRVVIGAGAKVLGPITVGDGARVGAGSVVTRPVEAGATVVGVPAHAVRKQRSALLPMPNLEHTDTFDPVVEAVRALLLRIDEVETELRVLRGLQHQHASDDRRSADETLAALMRDGGGI